MHWERRGFCAAAVPSLGAGQVCRGSEARWRCALAPGLGRGWQPLHLDESPSCMSASAHVPAGPRPAAHLGASSLGDGRGPPGARVSRLQNVPLLQGSSVSFLRMFLIWKVAFNYKVVLSGIQQKRDLSGKAGVFFSFT